MSLAAPLLTAVLLAQTVSSPSPDFSPDERLTPPEGPQIAVFRNVPGAVVSLRLSFLMAEEAAEAGAGKLIQVQALERASVLAGRVGARVEVHRTPQALVYQVSGPAADWDFLGWILREAIRSPSDSELEPARRQVRVESDRRMETPEGVLEARIRSRLTPGVPSVHGTPGTLDRMDSGRLRAIWERTHRRENARLVVVGRIPTELVLAFVGDLELPDLPNTVPAPPPEGTGVADAAPELIRHWTVDAYPFLRRDEGAALVSARWIAERARAEGADYEIGVEIWEMAGDRALLVTGAAFARSASQLESRLASLFEDAARLITEDDVTRLSHEVRMEVLLSGRTPWGLAELAGQAWDAGEGPEGLESLLTELQGLSYLRVIDFLRTMGGTSPIREVLRP